MLYFTILLLQTFLLTINAYSAYNRSMLQVNIIGGVRSDIRKFPYQVSILDLDGLACGGSIISKRHVLTITPCVTDTTPPLKIYAGSSFWENPGSIHHVINSATFGSKRNTDPAVLKVNEPFVFDSTRQPIRLFPAGGVIKGGTMAVVSGWGVTKSGDWSNELMSAQVKIVDRNACNQLYSGKLKTGEICAGGFGVDSCQGDSGGPLVINSCLVGITSMGNNCGLLKYPSIYTDVGYYNKWIMLQTAK